MLKKKKAKKTKKAKKAKKVQITKNKKIKGNLKLTTKTTEKKKWHSRS